MSDNIATLNYAEAMSALPAPFKPDFNIEKLLGSRSRTIVVLDDDPTGIQTVHGVKVFMEWSEKTLVDAFKNERLFYIQTNSRSLSKSETIKLHREISALLIPAAKAAGVASFSVISRSDSTLRWNYPEETGTLREELEKAGIHYDAELIIPYFFEGGRFTINDVHYVKQGDDLVPAGQTEFAKDATFHYESSDLKDYVEEKTGGAYLAKDMLSVPLAMLRSGDIDGIAAILTSASGFNKIVVNACCDDDLRVLSLALYKAEAAGKSFMFRTAASFVKIYGLITDKALLGARELCPEGKGAVLTVSGSHVQKTRSQVKTLLKEPGVAPIMLDVSEVLAADDVGVITAKFAKTIDDVLSLGGNPVLFTSSIETGPVDDSLENAAKISSALVDIVKKVAVRPRCFISKGGITSSDLAVKGLGIDAAEVQGQILPGVPVIKAGASSKWPGVCHVIFPGNVGDEDALAVAFNKLNP